MPLGHKVAGTAQAGLRHSQYTSSVPTSIFIEEQRQETLAKPSVKQQESSTKFTHRQRELGCIQAHADEMRRAAFPYRRSSADSAMQKG
jgi:hypothetical protein